MFAEWKSDMVRQIAALPVKHRPDGSLDVFLVTSRGSGRWIIPKGNPIRGLSPEDVAAREALEEAGLVGRVLPRIIGTFEFQRMRTPSGQTCLIDVYPMHVHRQVRKFDEKRQRTVLRCDLEMALAIVSSKSLAALIEEYSLEVRSERSAAGG
jgi:8-oxo-dGTP pyrophosphatase MutT (NUDIX family)